MIRLAFLLFSLIPMIFPQGVATPVGSLPRGGGGTVLPTLTTHTVIQGNSTNVTQQSISIASGNVSGQAIVVFVKWGDTTPGHFSSIQDCAQSSGNCASSADTFTQQTTCTAGNVSAAATACAFTVCSSSMASGAWTFTLNLTTAAPFLTLAVSTWANVPTSACVDQTGITTSGAGASANPSVTTGGNIAQSNEVAVSMVASDVTNPASACSGTQIDQTFGIQHQYATNPATGSAFTACWTQSSSNWEAQVVTLK